jgi:putative ABC transport system ATP-binding protein
VVLLLLLVFSGVLKGFQAYMIELFHRKFYARTASDIALNLINSNIGEFRKKNGVELVNRYFDIVLVQKSIALLLTDAVTVIMQTVVGLLLLAFYHPYFLVFDVLLVLLLWLVWSMYGNAALNTAVQESKAKYKVASWLEDMAKENSFFKSEARSKFAAGKADTYINFFLDKREKHFRKVFGQFIILLMIYAFMSALILGLGGFLVIKGQLSLGQLVAAELIITVMLSNLAKSGKYLESFYDLYAAVDKITQLYDIPQESKLKDEFIVTTDQSGVCFDGISIHTDRYDFEFNFQMEHHSKSIIKTPFKSTELLLMDILRGVEYNYKGEVRIGDVDITKIPKQSLRDIVYLVDRPSFFTGSLYENLVLSNTHLTDHDIEVVLKALELEHLYETLENGLETDILPNGQPLWSSQMIRFEIAKGILASPNILVISDLFNLLDEKRQQKLLNYLSSKDMTVMIFSNEAQHSSFINIEVDKDCMVTKGGKND